MITVLVKYNEWRQAPHPQLEDYIAKSSKVVEVEKLIELNDMFSAITDVKILERNDD